AERLLDDVAREVLRERHAAVVDFAVYRVDLYSETEPLRVVREVDEDPETEAQRHPQRRANERFAHFDDVRAALKDAEIQCQAHQDEGDETDPYEHQGTTSNYAQLSNRGDHGALPHSLR